MMTERIKVAVITEFHPVDMISFQRMFTSFSKCECFVQSFDMFVADEENQASYDVVLFYNLSIPLLDEGNAIRTYLEEKLGSAKQGIILLHHAICCYPGWDLWTELSGVKNRAFRYHWDQTVLFEPEAKKHPILEGVSSFTMVDETYTMEEPGYGENDILLTTEHDPSMHAIAWTRSYKNARVFCYESGHDKQAYTDDTFCKILQNGIEWCAGRS